MKFILKHKVITIILIIAIAGGGYYAYKKIGGGKTQTSYELGAVETNDIIVSVSGSGQVSASNQADIKTNASGKVLKLNIKTGQEVKMGAILAQLDSKEAQKTLKNAQIDLTNARISLEKLKRGTSDTDLKTAQLQLESAKNSLTEAQNNLIQVQQNIALDLETANTNAKNSLRDAYNTADDIINRQLTDIITVYNDYEIDLTFNTTDEQAKINAKNAWPKATAAVNKLKDLVAQLDVTGLKVDSQTGAAIGYLTDIDNLLQYINEASTEAVITSSFTASDVNSTKNTLNSARNSINTSISDLENKKQAITTQINTNQNNLTAAQNKITSAQNSLAQTQNSYDNKVAGTDPLDIRSQELAVSQREIAVQNAQDALADYTVRAPFDGIIAAVNISEGDETSANTALATIITKQQLVEIALNEVDASKVKISQKASLTFDAIDGLEITGKIIDIDTIGTVTQGVVSYNAKIGLDTQDDRIKPGMSASASIITQLKQNILTVPSSAIKTQGNSSYVQMLDPAGITATSSAGITSTLPPINQTVVTGISDDTNTEIISGLNLDDQIIIRTITSAVTVGSASQAPSILQSVSGQRTGATGGTGVRVNTGGGFPRD